MNFVSLKLFTGSPPPTRGTQSLVVKFVKAYRITPAYAGNTGQFIMAQLAKGDHPRLRGEHPKR